MTDDPVAWPMSAALENVSRGNGDVAEAASLESAVRAWIALDARQREAES